MLKKRAVLILVRGEGRTKYRQLDWQLKDSLAVSSVFLLGSLLFFLKNPL